MISLLCFIIIFVYIEYNGVPWEDKESDDGVE
ncbi:hypothetical protein GLYMA_20G005850v4 [Glycine max]|nr:hypothetical protein GLYMA_20G005850v4 [Glycine max]KAH1033935.1 hypothetical protein GYH30_054372 [Glycine max]